MRRVQKSSHQPTSYIDLSPWAARVRPVALDFRTSGALSSFARSCRGNGGGRVRASVGACKKINNLRPSYRHTGVAIGTSAKTHKKSTEHGACLLRGQCSRASIPRLSFGGHEKQLSRAYGAALRVAGGGAAPSGVRAEEETARHGRIPL